jgi:hypothetical protein
MLIQSTNHVSASFSDSGIARVRDVERVSFSLCTCITGLLLLGVVCVRRNRWHIGKDAVTHRSGYIVLSMAEVLGLLRVWNVRLRSGIQCMSLDIWKHARMCVHVYAFTIKEIGKGRYTFIVFPISFLGKKTRSVETVSGIQVAFFFFFIISSLTIVFGICWKYSSFGDVSSLFWGLGLE